VTARLWKGFSFSFISYASHMALRWPARASTPPEACCIRRKSITFSALHSERFSGGWWVLRNSQKEDQSSLGFLMLRAVSEDLPLTVAMMHPEPDKTLLPSLISLVLTLTSTCFSDCSLLLSLFGSAFLLRQTLTISAFQYFPSFSTVSIGSIVANTINLISSNHS
ncbi:unnamed protein product, partial [Brassica oleracea var. botrytis]